MRRLLAALTLGTLILTGCGGVGGTTTPAPPTKGQNAMVVDDPDQKDTKISLGQDQTRCNSEVLGWGNVYKALVTYRDSGSGDEGLSTDLYASSVLVQKVEQYLPQVDAPTLRAGYQAIVDTGQVAKEAFADPANPQAFDAAPLVQALDLTAQACEDGGVNISWYAGTG